jgi:thiol-disulfide isomerase/thioredoxin
MKNYNIFKRNTISKCYLIGQNVFLIRKSMFVSFILLCCSTLLNAQTISGNLSLLANQSIKLEGYNGLKTYPISTTTIDEKGGFTLTFSKSDYGVAYLMSADNKPYFVILSEEEILLSGEALSYAESLKVIKGKENFWFEQYAKEQPKREQALSAWAYLSKLYASDSLFKKEKKSQKAIQKEQQRLIKQEQQFLKKLPANSYAIWYLPTRKLVSSVSSIAQYRSEEIPATVSAFRKLDYTDPRLYKSGLFKDAIESHFWLLENSGKPLDSVFVEMKISIDAMMVKLVSNEKILNELTDYLFDLLERHSLFQASEYLAIKVLNEVSCTINSDLANQLETYRAMKKGNIAPEILFTGMQSNLRNMEGMQKLSDLQSDYTVVVFGASWCPKCTEELPEIAKLYPNWKANKVEVVLVSLDDKPQDFEKFTQSYPFLSICDFQKWDSRIAKDYFVFGTPTMYLLDKERKIILRPNSVKQMDAWVDWFLVQGNLQR